MTDDERREADAVREVLGSIGGEDGARRVARMEGLAADYLRQEIDLRREYAGEGLRLMRAQIIIADVVFVWYASANDWNLPSAAIAGWLGATVAQVIAIAVAVTRGLFRTPPSQSGGS